LKRCRIHVRKGGNTAKYFIVPEIMLDSSYGFNSKELNMLEKQVVSNLELIRSKWNEYFNK